MGTILHETNRRLKMTWADAYNQAAVMAIDAGNLPSVGRALRSKFAATPILFMADEEDSGVGLLKAWEAAAGCGGDVITPTDLKEVME